MSFSSRHINGCFLSAWLIPDVVLNHLAKVVFATFLHCKVISSSFSHCTPRKQVTKCGPHLWGRELCSTCPRVKNLHKLLGILYRRVLSPPLTYLFNCVYLYQYELMDIYSSGYNPMLHYLFCCSNCYSFGHWEFFQLALCFLTYPHHLGFFLSAFLFSDIIWCSRLILSCIFSVLALELAIFVLKINAESGKNCSDVYRSLEQKRQSRSRSTDTWSTCSLTRKFAGGEGSLFH